MVFGVFLSIFLVSNPVSSEQLSLASTTCAQSLGWVSKVPLLEMVPTYRGEEKLNPGVSGLFVRYFSPETIDSFALDFSNGRVMFQGAPLTTGFKGLTASWDRKHGLITLNADGRLIGYPDLQDPHVHHSSVSAGESVYFGGTWIVESGKIKKITRLTGHFRSNLIHLMSFLKYLESKGADLSEAEVFTEINDDSIHFPATFILKNLNENFDFQRSLALGYRETTEPKIKRAVEDFFYRHYKIILDPQRQAGLAGGIR